jgi:Gluconate 2-dehydrogenase subunit 3
MPINRRAMLAGSAGLVSTSFLWGCVGRGEGGTLTAPQMSLLDLVCDLVLPRTDTPGALDLKVPAFVALALQHGLDGTLNPSAPGAPTGNDYGAWLQQVLALDPKKALAEIDAAAFAKGAPPSPWRRIKGLILTGYFTSEAGASKVLQYEPVPGRFDPDIAIKPGGASWASDWTAVDFG